MRGNSIKYLRLPDEAGREGGWDFLGFSSSAVAGEFAMPKEGKKFFCFWVDVVYKGCGKRSRRDDG